MGKITIGYWKIRGLGQPLRLILKYAEQDFEDVQYEQGDAPGYSRESWTKVKDTLGIPFPNLPYMIDGDVKISQSNAIMRYLGKKFGLMGATVQEEALNDMLLEYAMDLRNAAMRIVYNKDYANLVGPHFDNQKARFEQFNAFLEGKDWFAGGKTPTICDFHLYEMFDQHRLMKPGYVEQFPNIMNFQKRFEALPQIKAYMASKEFIERPLNNKVATFK